MSLFMSVEIARYLLLFGEATYNNSLYIYIYCGVWPKYDGLFQIQARPRSVLSEEKPRMKRCSIPMTPRKPVRGVTPPRTPRSPDKKLSPLTPVHPPNI